MSKEEVKSVSKPRNSFIRSVAACLRFDIAVSIPMTPSLTLDAQNSVTIALRVSVSSGPTG